MKNIGVTNVPADSIDIMLLSTGEALVTLYQNPIETPLDNGGMAYTTDIVKLKISSLQVSLLGIDGLRKKIVAKFDYYWDLGDSEENGTLKEQQEALLKEAGEMFAAKRDAIRWITVSNGKYGFDRASEDITNFMAAQKAAELSGSAEYKVWLTESSKGLVVLISSDFTTVFKSVRDSQLETYAWYEGIKSQIVATTSKAGLEGIKLE